jgi:hypothetical protein
MHYAITKKKWFHIIRCGFKSVFSKLLSITDRLSFGGLIEDKALHQWKHFQRLPLQHDGGLIRGVCRTRLAVFINL